jgi:hypothetical protein
MTVKVMGLACRRGVPCSFRVRYGSAPGRRLPSAPFTTARHRRGTPAAIERKPIRHVASGRRPCVGVSPVTGETRLRE